MANLIQSINIINKNNKKINIPLGTPIEYLAHIDRTLNVNDLRYYNGGAFNLAKYMDKVSNDVDFFDGLENVDDRITFSNGYIKVVTNWNESGFVYDGNFRVKDLTLEFFNSSNRSQGSLRIHRYLKQNSTGNIYNLKYILYKIGTNGIEVPNAVGESNIQSYINNGMLHNLPISQGSMSINDYLLIPFNNDLFTDVGGKSGFLFNQLEGKAYNCDRFPLYRNQPQYGSICTLLDGITREVVVEGEDFGEISNLGGQDGTLDNTSDTISDDLLPTTNAVSSGLVKLYKLNTAQLQLLSNYLYSAPTEFLEHLKKLFTEPMQAILQISLINYSPSGTNSPIVICGRSTDINAEKLSTQFVLLDCGNLKISKYYGNSLDYAPYTKINLHLFGVGTVQLNVDDVMDKTINVKYKIDLLSGACVVFVSVNGSVMYIYQGSVTSQMPITSNDSKSLYASVVSAVISGASAIATGGASIPISGMVASGLSVMGSKENITRGGSITGSASLLDVKKPFVTIVRPIQSLPQNFKHFKGYTSNITETLSNVSGYTEIKYIDLQGVDATKEEKEMLQSVLKNGFYI